MKLNGRRVVIAVSFLVSALVSGSLPAEAQEEEQVTPIKPPARPLPDETASAGVTKYSFIAYGDTRGRRDGIAIQYEHSLIVDSMLAQIKKLERASAEFERAVFFETDPFKPHRQNAAATRGNFAGCAFCHEVKTAAKTYDINDWVSIRSGT